MPKSNIDRKMTFEDKYGRHYYCEHAKRNQVLAYKKINRRKARRIMNSEATAGSDDD